MWETVLTSLVAGFSSFTWQAAVLILAGGVLLYLAIAKNIEPLLLVPIGFGVILGNLPLSGMAASDKGRPLPLQLRQDQACECGCIVRDKKTGDRNRCRDAARHDRRTVNGRQPLPCQKEELLKALRVVAEGMRDVDVVGAEGFAAKGLFASDNGFSHGHLRLRVREARGHIDDGFLRVLDHHLHLVPLGNLRR